jgi:Fe-S-cluster-containing hydrogenase component 2
MEESMEENKLRGLDTAIRRIRKQVFTEIADIAFSGADLREIEKIPYIISPGDVPRYRESIYRERAVSSERVRLAMGLSLRPEDAPVHITSGVEETNIGQLYYEPPLMQVIPSACYACENHVFEVSNQCKGCLAQPCAEVCPTEAIHRVRGFAVIEQDKCIQCGKCKEVCPYDAISEKRRPCADACGVNAIESDHMGRASINQRKCVSCGMCMTSCPFGAISRRFIR